MRVICSWCENEGRPALVREKAPLSDNRDTHGICADHLQQLGVGRDPLMPCYEEGRCLAMNQSSPAGDMPPLLHCYDLTNV